MPEGWTVLDHPSNYPQFFVARKWVAVGGVLFGRGVADSDRGEFNWAWPHRHRAVRRADPGAWLVGSVSQSDGFMSGSANRYTGVPQGSDPFSLAEAGD
jgi:hypothetical protein